MGVLKNLNFLKNWIEKKSLQTVLKYEINSTKTVGLVRLTNQVGNVLKSFNGFCALILFVARSKDVVDVLQNRLGYFRLVHSVKVNAADTV